MKFPCPPNPLGVAACLAGSAVWFAKDWREVCSATQLHQQRQEAGAALQLRSLIVNDICLLLADTPAAEGAAEGAGGLQALKSVRESFAGELHWLTTRTKPCVCHTMSFQHTSPPAASCCHIVWYAE